MTNKEAIAILNPLFEQCKGANGCLGYIEHYFSKEEETDLDLAIKALEEKPQAEWIRIGSFGNGNAQYECSNCYYNDEQAESQEVPYCWHCGAKMMKEDVKNDKD